MTQEEQILFKVLCEGLQYGLKLKTPHGNATLLGIVNRKGFRKGIDYIDVVTDKQTYLIQYIKPYLRSLSSMTEEEWGQYMNFIEQTYNDYEGFVYTNCIDKERVHEYLNFIYSHHLDDNNLISMELALEASEGMYKEE